MSSDGYGDFALGKCDSCTKHVEDDPFVVCRVSIVQGTSRPAKYHVLWDGKSSCFPSCVQWGVTWKPFFLDVLHWLTKMKH